jgi:hypothetical protein
MEGTMPRLRCRTDPNYNFNASSQQKIERHYWFRNRRAPATPQNQRVLCNRCLQSGKIRPEVPGPLICCHSLDLQPPLLPFDPRSDQAIQRPNIRSVGRLAQVDAREEGDYGCDFEYASNYDAFFLFRDKD